MIATVTKSEIAAAAESIGRRLHAIKEKRPLASYGWYPYDSLTALPILNALFEDEDWTSISEALASEPLIDVGCADGDLAFFFESVFRCGADAVDHPESNYNQMLGVRAMREELGSTVEVHALDLDGRFELPRKQYGLALFLGTLYHLKNPFYILEQLAIRSAYTVVSTRIAQRSPSGVPIDREALAYLLGSREANNDPTNFWIFSRTALLRLVQRAGWSVERELRVGATTDSNPVDPARDERMFLFLRSRLRFPALRFRPLEGWHALESDQWRWTARRFTFEVTLPKDEVATEFALKIVLPDVLLAGGDVVLSCAIDGQPAGSNRFGGPGTHEFRGAFPPGISKSEPMLFTFDVSHQFRPEGDFRDLGVIIPFNKEALAATGGLPFRIS